MQNCHAFLSGLFPGGVLLTERILSSASYVGRRGKPSTWLPRQKLAEARPLQKHDFLMTKIFRKFFGAKTGFDEQIFLISGVLQSSWRFACAQLLRCLTPDFSQIMARAAVNPAGSEKPTKIHPKLRAAVRRFSAAGVLLTE